MPSIPTRAEATGHPAPELLIDKMKELEPCHDDFDPEKHLAFKGPSKVYSLKELGLPEEIGISSVAVSEPFRLFTADAIHRMRGEVLRPVVLQTCQFSSDIAQCQLRGFAARYAPFVYDAWKHPATLAAISGIAGVDLVPAMDYEIGQVNISVKSEGSGRDKVKEQIDKVGGANEAAMTCHSTEYDKPVVDWHYDSYPFVCVTMLSDCSDMEGGETAVKTGRGEILKVRGPQMGFAVVLQGRYVEHKALRALGSKERITMVTSFRCRCPRLRDDTVLKTVRSISNLSQLYYEFCEYRLEILEERIRMQLRALREAKGRDKKFSPAALKCFLQEQVAFLAHMNEEVVLEASVGTSLISPIGQAQAETVKASIAPELA